MPDTPNDYIRGEVGFFREDGRWHMAIIAPKWVLAELRNDFINGRVLTWASYAGSHMLLQVVPRNPDRQEEAEKQGDEPCATV